MSAPTELLVHVGRFLNWFFVTGFPKSPSLSGTHFLFLLFAEELYVHAACDFSVLIPRHVLRSQPFAQLVFRFPRCALHTKFGQHEFLGPSSPDTFLGVPAHPGARLPGHVTDFPGLRFRTVDFDETKRIVHLFSCFQFLCEQRPQYIVSVFPFLEL